MTERNRGIVRPEGGNMFIVFGFFCEMNSRSISLASLEVGLGSVGTLPLGVDRKGIGGGTITEHNLWLVPINMWVMFSEPSISKDDVIVS